MMLLLLVALGCAFAAGWFACLGVQDLRRARKMAEDEERARQYAVNVYADAKVKSRGWQADYDTRHDTTPWGERSRPGR